MNIPRGELIKNNNTSKTCILVIKRIHFCVYVAYTLCRFSTIK